MIVTYDFKVLLTKEVPRFPTAAITRLVRGELEVALLRAMETEFNIEVKIGGVEEK